MYRIMGDRPMTIRYLDPPLHEFLPTQKADIEELAQEMGMTVEELQDVVVSLHEFNPMMGHRGCRLCCHLPGDRRDADQRRHQGCPQGQRGDRQDDHAATS